jgi:hypothetical protein
MGVALEAARKHLSELWASSSRTFKFLATPAKAPKAPPPPKARPAPPPRLTDGESFSALIGMASPARDVAQGSASAEPDGGGTSSSGGGGASSDVASQLRAGWIPFGARPPPQPKAAAARKGVRKVLHRPEEATLDLLSPAIELPQQLGRGDVHQKRKHKIQRTTVPVVVGHDDVTAALAPKMRRSQAFAIPDNRPEILAECVAAHRAAAR